MTFVLGTATSRLSPALAVVVVATWAPVVVAQESAPPAAEADAPVEDAAAAQPESAPVEPPAPPDPVDQTPAAEAPRQPLEVPAATEVTEPEGEPEERPKRRHKRKRKRMAAEREAAVDEGAELHRAPPAPYVERGWHVRGRALLTSWLNVDASLQALKSDPLVTLGGFAVEGEWLPFGDVSLTLDLGYSGGGFASKLFDAIDTRTQLHVVSLGAGAGYRFADVVLPYARVGGTVTLLEATFYGDHDVYGGWDLFTPGAFALAGVELTIPRRMVPLHLFTAGLFAELGYLHLGSFDFEPSVSEADLVERRLFDPGTLHLGGPTLRGGLTVSF